MTEHIAFPIREILSLHGGEYHGADDEKPPCKIWSDRELASQGHFHGAGSKVQKTAGVDEVSGHGI